MFRTPALSIVFRTKTALLPVTGTLVMVLYSNGCHIGRNALIGMNAVVMDDAVIGAESLVAASSFVKTGFECSPRSLVAGSPATVRRPLSDQEVAWKTEGTLEYQRLTVRSRQTLREVSALTRVEKERPRHKSKHND